MTPFEAGRGLLGNDDFIWPKVTSRNGPTSATSATGSDGERPLR